MDFNIQLNNNDQIKSYSPHSYNKDIENMKKSSDAKETLYKGTNESEEESIETKAKGCCSFLSIQYYQPYFNITQQQVLGRIIKSLTPWKNDFFDTARNLPDLYGPFWILTTIIFLLSSTGNLSNYFYNWKKAEFFFQLELVRYGVLIVYSFGIGFPAILAILFKLYESQITIFHLICIYGYSLSCFILILLLCIIPTTILQWILIVYGILNSSSFLILNIHQEIKNLTKTKQYIVYGLIAACQIGLFLTFKLVFFNLKEFKQVQNS